MQNEDSEEESRSYYVSALHPKHSPKYTPTRKHSSEGSSSSSLFSRHGRSRTDSNSNRSMRRYHPLTNTRNDLPGSTEVTRPHLTRTVNQVDGDTRADESRSEDDDMEFRKEEERDVLVHHVKPKDSLAGVALKYDISLADLRRANHLWANDSIHIRKVLYIPVDKSSKARELAHEMKLKAAPLVELSTPSVQSSSGTSDDDTEATSSLDNTAFDGWGIQRIPVSRMSFFPPPSSSGKAPSVLSTPTSSPSSNFRATSQARYTVSSSLSSFLTALPIAPSKRDDLLARISFDSTSSSVSDRSRPSIEPLEGHELDVVSSHATRFSPRPAAGTIWISGSTSLSHSRPSDDEHIGSSTINSQTTRRMLPHHHHHRHSSTTPPTSYIPRIPDTTTIRTVQMEPSPIMQLPVLHSRKLPLSIKHRNLDTRRQHSTSESASINLINLG